MGARDQIRASLGALDQAVAGSPTAELHVARARVLMALGETDSAKQAFLDALALDPTNFAALNDFGALLRELNYRAAARTLFGEAVRLHPREALGRVNVANLLMYEGELAAARDQLLAALEIEPDNCAAHQRLSELARETGDEKAMRTHRRLGFGPKAVEVLPFVGECEPVPMLVLTSTPAADLAWPKLIDNRRFAVTTIVAEFFERTAALPPHRLIFNAIADADIARADLRAARAIVGRSVAPVINHPGRVLATGRLAIGRRLGRIDGVVASVAVSLPREAFLRPDAARRLAGQGLAFPLLLRTPGFHNGRHFVRVERAEALAEAASALPGAKLTALQFLDARGPDDFVRKYRVMLIGGEIYPLHLAISPNWKVHYATAAMAERPDFRQEEARFLSGMADAIGTTAVAALRQIQATLGLDYAGVDFGLAPDGRLLLFEANAVMSIFDPGEDSRWNYRCAAVAAAIAASRRTLMIE